MIRAFHTFPRGFLWGTGTAAHQVEGDNRANDWWAWEQQPGRIVNGDRSGKACDWWGGRWQEDLDRAAADGQNAHRLSLEWSRLEPEPGRWDASVLEAYRTMLQGARERGLLPLVTLHHFTNPAWLADSGGWLEPATAERFAAFVRRAVDGLKDLVDTWFTINEPNVYAYAAYSAGAFPPGEKDFGKALRVMSVMIRAHAMAYHVIHEAQPQAQVGLAHNYRGMQAAHRWHPLERASAAIRSTIFNDRLAQAVYDGRLRFPLPRETLALAARTQDFIGLNYYTTENVSFDLRASGELFGRSVYPAGSDLSPSAFVANRPEGFWQALRWARQFRLPIVISENGIDDATDGVRPRYLACHLRQLWRAVNFNWNVRGYLHWTLVDNFEWERGWSQRFGLWALDPLTQARTRRPSADLYAKICKSNGLSSEMVAQHAPEVLDDLFPGSGPGRVAFEPPV